MEMNSIKGTNKWNLISKNDTKNFKKIQKTLVLITADESVTQLKDRDEQLCKIHHREPREWINEGKYKTH